MGNNRPVRAWYTPQGWGSTQIAFEDYARFNTQTHAQSGERRLPTPDWSVNDKKLRILLVEFLEERAGFRLKKRKPLAAAIKAVRKGETRLRVATRAIVAQRPRKMEILDGLLTRYAMAKKLGSHPDLSDADIMAMHAKLYGSTPPMFASEDDTNYRLFDAKAARANLTEHNLEALAVQIEGHDTYIRIFTETGGAEIITAIVYLYYRVGLDSVGVGAELGLKPPHVRQTLWRLHETWNKMASQRPGFMGTQIKANPASQPATDTSDEDCLTSPLFDILGT